MGPTIGLLRGDARNLVRDPMLALITALPLVIGLVFRLTAPWLAELLDDWVDLRASFGLLTAFLVLTAPMMLGWVVGFMLLDDRDEQVLAAVMVTPLGKAGFLRYRMALPVVASFVAALVVVPLCALVEVPLVRLMAVSALAALEAPMLALVLAAFAGNKVEGMALGKGLSLLNVAPFTALLVPMPWQLIAGVVPQYWVAKLVLISDEASTPVFWSMAAVALVVHLVTLGWLSRRFSGRIE